MPERPRVAVVGGGITGLACAWYLRERASVTLLEAGPRLGGRIRTGSVAGVPVEAGPDTFLARVPWAADLCREVGLGGDLVEPAPGPVFVWTGGRLRELPAGLVLGVPARLGPVVRSGLLSPGGVARAALDLVLPASRRPDDPTVAEVIGGRFGSEVVDRLVEPLLGGIHAGRADRLSLSSVAPQVAAAAGGSRSLLAGLRRLPPGAGGPVFQSVRGGLERLVERLAEAPGVDVRLESEVGSVVDLDVDAAVLTVPAWSAGSIVRSAAPEAAAQLDAVRYASVVTVTLGYEPAAVGRELVGSGFLVPRVDGRLATACTFLTSKWPDLARSGLVMLRVSSGRDGDERALGLDDAALVEALHAEMAEALGLRAGPVVTAVHRWPRALPQYESGHSARIARARADLSARLPAVVLAGAAYGGLGIAACVRQAREAADLVAARIGGAGGFPEP
jgi:oxygen-dependent protoporphyrinogen oxidase